MRLGTLENSVIDNIRAAILGRLPDADVEVTGQGAHFSLRVRSAEFAGKSRLAQQRLVLGAIAPLMSGPNAPVHAIDKLDIQVP